MFAVKLTWVKPELQQHDKFEVTDVNPTHDIFSIPDPLDIGDLHTNLDIVQENKKK